MTGKTIATLYFYVISAGAVVLMTIGIFNAVNFGINSTQYEKYPLPWGENNCENYPIPLYGKGAIPMDTLVSIPPEGTPSAGELERQKQFCLKQQELERKKYQVTDLKNSITFTLVGLVLFIIHFPKARKQSQE